MYYDDQRLPACYLNFYIANGVVIVPPFDDPADQVALDTLGRLFPDRADPRHSMPSTWSGAWARSTASRSSNRPEFLRWASQPVAP